MTTHLTKLYGFLVNYYSLDELNILCFELGIEYENLGGRTRNSKARELILHLGREQRFDELFAQLKASRPRAYKQEEFDTSQEAIQVYYDELDAFETETQPLTEKILGRVGLEQRAGFVLVLITTILAVALLYFGLREVGPDRMTGDFNVAVAPFQVIGEGEEPERGEDVANSIYGRLQANFEELDTPIIHVWGPELPRLNPIPVIKGNTAEERATAAEKLANDIDADIVIYGVVTTENGNWLVTPEFFVSAQNFQEAAEILGQYNIGKPFQVLGDDPRALRISAGDKMRPRSESIAKMAIGLTYYSVTNYDRALDEFKQLVEKGLLTEESGADVVYMMLGNTLGKQAAAILQNADVCNPDPTPNEQVTNLLTEAAANYDKALAINPDSARPYSGKGSVAYLLALSNGNQVDMTQLQKSIELLNEGVNAPNKPPYSHVEAKLHLNLGQSYLLLALINEIGFEHATQEFNQVIAEYEGLSDDNDVMQELAGEAYARLGLIYEQLSDVDSAIAAYESAAELLKARPDRRDLYLENVEALQTTGKITRCQEPSE